MSQQYPGGTGVSRVERAHLPANLLVGLALVVLLFLALAGLFLWQSATTLYERAADNAESHGKLLESTLYSTLHEPELVLRVAAAEYLRRRQAGHYDAQAFAAYLDELGKGMAAVSRILIADANGQVEGVLTNDGTGRPVYVGDRGYFAEARDNPGKMAISSPLRGRASGEWTMPLAIRLDDQRGQFAGVLFASLRVQGLAQLFTTLQVGRHGALVVFDETARIALRHPEPKGEGSAIGLKIGSPEFQALWSKGLRSATYRARSTTDQIRRTYHYRQVGDYRLFVMVGIAEDDTLLPWNRQLEVAAAFLGLVVVLAGYLLWHLRRAIVEQQRGYLDLAASQRELRAAQAERDDLLKRIPVGVFRWRISGDGTSRFDFVSPTFCAQLGVKECEVLHDDGVAFRAMHPDDLSGFVAAIAQANAGEEHFSWSGRARRDGETRWLLIESSAQRSQDEIVWNGVQSDITERVLAERQLRQERDFSNGVLDTARCLIMVMDRRGAIVRINRDALEFTGYGFAEMRDQPFFWTRFLLPEQRDGVVGVFDKLFAGNVVARYENYWLRHDGEKRLFDWSNSLICGPDGNAEYLVTVGIDITERKLAEERLQSLATSLDSQVQAEVAKNLEQQNVLIQQSRMAAMGEMIGNIAHQWRQPLNALGLLLANIKDAQDFGELDETFMDNSLVKGRQLIEKMSTTIDDFRNFFKPNKQKVPFSLEQPTYEALNLIAHSLKANNIVVTVASDPAARTCGFPNEFSQVVLNFLSNAKDALLERQTHAGTIRVSIGEDAERVWVSVADNAGGIPDEVLANLFEPYFTTKEKGTGIGLYMSRMIVEHMGGSIEVRNLDNGAEFRVILPACRD